MGHDRIRLQIAGAAAILLLREFSVDFGSLHALYSAHFLMGHDQIRLQIAGAVAFHLLQASSVALAVFMALSVLNFLLVTYATAS